MFVSVIFVVNIIVVFDDCGGYINLVEGYYYYVVLGCSDVIILVDGYVNFIGYVLDGYGIYVMLNLIGEEDYDFDECRGYSDDMRGYYYYVVSVVENMFIGCYSGV